MDLINLKEYVLAITKVWNEPHYITLQVLVHNMAFDGKTNPEAMNAIKAMSILREGDHVVRHVYETLGCIQMVEDYLES